MIDVRVNGTPVKAVAQVTKQGFVLRLRPRDWPPIWPIEERPVPQSTVPGEKSSPTQPFPTRPAPFDRQGVTENDVVDFTPELRNGGAGGSGEVQLRSTVHAAFAREAHDSYARHGPEARAGRVRRATPRPG